MKILITGATGYLGGAIAEAVAAAGHDVVALTRSQSSESAVRDRGWSAAAGSLHDTDRLADLARESDGVVHAAITGEADAAEVDEAATRAFLTALEGSNKPFVYTSGVWVLGDTGGRLVDETTPIGRPAAKSAWRLTLEPEIARAAGRGVHSVVIRPGVVFGRGGGLCEMLTRGELPVIGSGRNRWPLVHIDDLSDLYLRAFDAPPGSILHGTDGWAAMVELAIAGRVGAGGRPEDVERIGTAAARERLGDAFTEALTLDQRVTSERTRELTGWTPGGMPAIEELTVGSYVAASSA